MLDKNEWQQLDNNSTGYLGHKRNEAWQKRNELYGKSDWQMGWLVDGNLLEYPEVCQLYGDAYINYFRMRPELLDQLCKTASNVFDDDPINVESGTDFNKRGDVKTHIGDTAIRRAVQHFGRQFEGEILLQIHDRKGDHPLSLALSPGQVPYHNPKQLSRPDNLEEVHKGAWWVWGSVEDFYQRAKRLCVRKPQ